MKMKREIDLKNLTSEEKREIVKTLCAGDEILLSGTVFTARDAAHKRFFELLDKNEELPVDLNNAIIYYAGPTPKKDGFKIGSCGPTTSLRMDKFAPRLYSLGVLMTIGKGKRSREISESCKENNAVYLCAIGGAGALAATKITDCEEVAFFDLGCESVKKLEFDKFPLIVATDTNGNDIFDRKEDSK